MIKLKTLRKLSLSFFKDAPKSDLNYLLELATNTNQTDLVNNRKTTLLNACKFKWFLIKYSVNKNPYYVTRQKSFLDLDLLVNRHVLVPRFETEILIDQTIQLIKQYQIPLNIIDIGTGSGAIALSLKKYFPKANVLGVDISKKALKVANKNMKKNQLQINLKQQNLFKDSNTGYNVIISNPPYIDKKEKIDPIVYQTEPHLALFTEDNGLACYKAILTNYQDKISLPTLFAFEIGEEQKTAIKQLIKDHFPNAKIINKQDFNNKDRFVFAIIE